MAATPWAMKAAIGLLSDTIPFFGYHKRSYIFLVSVIGTVAFAVLGFVQFSTVTASVAAFLLLLGNLQMAAVDLLCEGKYAEMMVAKPESGSDLVSYVWGLYMVGKFFGSLVAGPMADHFNPRYIFIICLPLAAQVIFPAAAGWLPEERLPPDERHIRRDKISAHPNLVKLNLTMTVSAVAVGLSALVGSGDMQTVTSTITAVILCVLGFRWLPKMLRRANLYMFLSSMLYVSLPGALDYWFTGGPECVPGGPNFSYTYYATYASLVGSIAGAAGVAMFQRFLSRGNFRTAFWTTCLIKLAASFMDIAIVKRYNLRVGIPDTLAFMLGDAVVFEVAYTLDFMPAVVLTSKVCPKGMEASVYALLASYQNLGVNMSRALGVALIDTLGIKTTSPCNFTNLPWAIFIAHVLLPLLVFPLVFFLIPDANMTDDLMAMEEKEGDGDEFARVPIEDPDFIDPEHSDSETTEVVVDPPMRASAVPIYDVKDPGGEVEAQSLMSNATNSQSLSLTSYTPEQGVIGGNRGNTPTLATSAVEHEEDEIVHGKG